MNLRLELTSRILDIPFVEERKSKFGSEFAFFFGKREIAHFHSNETIDIRLTKRLIKDRKLTEKAPKSDWHEVIFTKEADLPRIVELIQAAVRANKSQ